MVADGAMEPVCLQEAVFTVVVGSLDDLLSQGFAVSIFVVSSFDVLVGNKLRTNFALDPRVFDQFKMVNVGVFVEIRK